MNILGKTMVGPAALSRSSRQMLVAGAVLAVCLLWFVWPTLAELAKRWSVDPKYTHGFLVPLFSVYLLWMRRSEHHGPWLRPSWWGLAVIAAGLGVYLFGSYFFFTWLN